MLLSAMRSKSAAAPSGAQTPGQESVISSMNVVAETPQGNPPPSNKKQRSIHDFFSQTNKKTDSSTSSVASKTGAGTHAGGRKRRSLTSAYSLENEPLKKRIDYDAMSQDSDFNNSLSQGSEASHGRTKPKRIDFGGICPSSQRSEPDIEPAQDVVVVEPYARQLSQSHYYGRMFSQDDFDFCTPQDQPVMHLSHPTTPSPMKKRQRRSLDVEMIQEEEVQNLTQDMTHMEVQPVPSVGGADGGDGSSLDSSDMLLTTPQRALGLPAPFLPGRRRDTFNSGKPPVGSVPSSSTVVNTSEAFTNPFAPLPPTDSRKRRPQRKRQSLPPAFMSSVPYSRYLSEFVEQELVGAGAFSKVFKCTKKIDGWTYAIKKSKRHFRGRADTERALREVQALAALSDSRHVVRYFDAWIEDDLLYIQLEHCRGCSLASFVDQHKPHHVPEETLCKVLCHIAQALYDLHGKRMVHMDVKLQNFLVTAEEVYKLGDLGTVALSDGSMEITEGDNRYLSRELLEGNRSNLRAGDIFALGASIYELALGTTLPNGGEEWQKIRDGDLTLFRQYSNSLQHLIASMMHPDPLQRPSAEEILQHEVVLPLRQRAS
ncbi:hypothetical protein Poli38472_002813 [Pythium oligandrum]|uniref:Protein kinase domain-containing protein n=1 Tax=Pythium oligandrum TaxID=41045 RepID=A0A8K1C5Y0_PYTOL|nr:hypothetical protein Poli38472_002813 [Pythium oligandrum]|eukprot:TMW56888.1 hypothetical protein Poli38472_002813 [Pythium oligandrum]